MACETPACRDLFENILPGASAEPSLGRSKPHQDRSRLESWVCL